MSAIFEETLTFNQENGTNVKLVVSGDEFYSRYETTDGYTVVYDIDLKQYCYAILLKGNFASSGVSITESPPDGIPRHLKESEIVHNEKFERRHNNMRPQDINMGFRTLGLNQGLLEGRRVSEGKVRGLTVLVEFPDVSTNITAKDVDEILNGKNYKKNGNYCSVREYFHLMSNGKLDYTNRVVGPIKLRKNRGYYANDGTISVLIKEVMDKVVNDLGIDLSEFDSTGAGIIDALNFMYAGQTVYQGDLWPHNSVIDLTYGGISTHYYMISSLGRDTVDLSIGTFCHENGHQLCRFPDLYDYGVRDGDFEKSAGLAFYCLMSAGNHLDSGRTPSPVCAYLRHLVNWTDTVIRLKDPGSYEIRHGDYGTVIIYETKKLNEYFIIENRSQLCLDTHLADGGLAVYHCDILGSNEWQGGTRDKHYQCGLLQADGHLDLETNQNTGDIGDLYRQKNGIALSHDTTPSSVCWDGSDSGLILTDISDQGEIIRFKFGSHIPVVTDVVTGKMKVNLLIPDNKPKGISSAINLNNTGKVNSIKISVNIFHSHADDLQVELLAPSGKKAMLYNRSKIGSDLLETYSSDSIKELADLKGESIDGEWILNVRDLKRRYTGRLNFWKIEIEPQL